MNINTGFLKNPLVWLAALGGIAVLIWMLFKQLRDTFKSTEETATSAPGDLIKNTLVKTAEGIKDAGKTLIGGIKNALGGSTPTVTTSKTETTAATVPYWADDEYNPNQYVF